MKTSLYFGIAVMLCFSIFQHESMNADASTVRRIEQGLNLFKCCVKYCKDDEDCIPLPPGSKRACKCVPENTWLDK